MKHQEPGRLQRRLSEVYQSVAIQLPSAENGNVRIKNVGVVEQFEKIFDDSTTTFKNIHSRCWYFFYALLGNHFTPSFETITSLQ